MSERICKKCLIEKIDPMGVLETVRQKVELIPAQERTGEEEYYQRLKSCTECDKLNLGMCELCGCFVEYRAAHSEMHCPGKPQKW